MTLIQDRFDKLFKNLSEEAASIIEMDHDGTKGFFREHFIKTLIDKMLPLHIGAGSGIIVDEYGNQSSQCDVILYDKRILPPFLSYGSTSVYPIQSVLAVIEVKSGITSKTKCKDICRNLEKTKSLFENYIDKITIGIPDKGSVIIARRYPCYFLIFSYNMTKAGDKIKGDLKDLQEEKGRKLLPSFITGYCIKGKCSNLCVQNEWRLQKNTSDEETTELRRFFAVTIDNVIREAENRFQNLMFLNVLHASREYYDKLPEEVKTFLSLSFEIKKEKDTYILHEKPRQALQNDLFSKYIRDK